MSTSTLRTESKLIPLRWLIVCTIAFVVLVGGFLVSDSIRQQRARVQTINFLNGHVAFRPIGPEWFRGWIAREKLQFLDQIESVRFMPDEATYRARYAGRFHGHYPFMGGQSIDDSTLSCIADCESLKELALAYTKVSDAGLGQIVNLQKLKHLDLRGTDVSDACVPLLTTLRNLETLDIGDTQIGKEKSAELQRALPGCKVSAIGFREMQQPGPDVGEEAMDVPSTVGAQ